MNMLRNMANWFVDLTGDDNTHVSGVEVIDLTGDEENGALQPAGLVSDRDQQSASGARKTGTEMWSEGIREMHRVTKPYARSKPRASTAETRRLMRAFDSAGQSPPVQTQDPYLTEQRPLPNFATLFPGTALVEGLSSGQPSVSRAPPRKEPSTTRPHGLFSIEEDDSVTSQRLPPAGIDPHASCNPEALRDLPSRFPPPSSSHLDTQVIAPASLARPFQRAFQWFSWPALSWKPTATVNDSHGESNAKLRSFDPPSSPPVPDALHKPDASYDDALLGPTIPSSPPILHPLEQQMEPEGTAANPIEIVDTEEEFAVHVRPVTPRPSTAQRELALYSDGSIAKGSWGGCGVAYWNNGHWCGRAIALGPLRKSGIAEMLGIYHAYKLASQLLIPEHRLVVIYTDVIEMAKKIADAKLPRYRNDELLQRIVLEDDSLLRQGVEVKICWVKGHSVSAGNQMADLLAGMASEQASFGHGGQSWENPDLGLVPIPAQLLRGLSQKAESKAANRLRDLRNGHTKAERRAHKIQQRLQRDAKRRDIQAHVNAIGGQSGAQRVQATIQRYITGQVLSTGPKRLASGMVVGGRLASAGGHAAQPVAEKRWT